MSNGKSNLKTSIPAVHASSSEKKPSPNPRHLAIALHHARQIQARKDSETNILSRIEDLMLLPTSPNASASNPSPNDIESFISGLNPFQPSDYDNLILERNIDGRCGYALCPREHRREDPKTKFRILWGPNGSGPGGRGKEMRVVPREKLEMWCCDECAKRAMYVKVQLSETPAWERAEGKNMHITLLDEPNQLNEQTTEMSRAGDMKDMEKNLQKLTLREASTDHAQLVHELDGLNMQDKSSRGYQPEAFGRASYDTDAEPGAETGHIPVHVVENEVGNLSASPPPPQLDNTTADMVEGFLPNHDTVRSNVYTRPEDVNVDDIFQQI